MANHDDKRYMMVHAVNGLKLHVNHNFGGNLADDCYEFYTGLGDENDKSLIRIPFDDGALEEFIRFFTNYSSVDHFVREWKEHADQISP